MALAIPGLELHEPPNGPEKLWAMFGARLKQFADRNDYYALLLKYYFGRQSRGTRKLHEVLGSTSTGRPLLRDLGVAFEIQRRYVSNRMAPIVEDYQALVGRMPSIRVQPPAGLDNAEKKADTQTKYLYSTYGEVDMAHQQAYAGFCLSSLGDAVYVLEPDRRSKRVLPYSVLPSQCLPAFQRGPRKFELWDLFTYSVWDPDEIEREFDFKPKDEDPKNCLVVTYLSPDQRTVMIGSPEKYEVVADAWWDLGFCPAVWLRNKVNGDLSSSDIAPVMALQDMYDFTLNVMADGLVEMTYPMRLVKGRIGGDSPAEMGPGSNVEVGPEGDLKVVALAPPPQAGMMMAQTVLEDINIGAGTTEVRQSGMPDRSNISGKALHAAQGPQATRIDLKQILLAEALVKLNAHMMAMQEKAPILRDADLELNGMYRATAFRIPFKPQEDINGWYLNTATFDELVGVTRQTRIQMAGMLRQEGLSDVEYAMELAGIQDPLEMKKRIEKEKRDEAKLMQELQGGAPPPGGGSGAPGGSPAGAPPAPQQPGFQHPPNVPQLGFKQPQPGAAGPPPLQGGVPMGASRKAVEKALEGVDLRGTVFVVGDLATSGQGDHIQVRISDARDYRAVKEALTPLDPKVDVKYMAEDKMPDDAVRVA